MASHVRSTVFQGATVDHQPETLRALVEQSEPDAPLDHSSPSTTLPSMTSTRNDDVSSNSTQLITEAWPVSVYNDTDEYLDEQYELTEQLWNGTVNISYSAGLRTIDEEVQKDDAHTQPIDNSVQLPEIMKLEARVKKGGDVEFGSVNVGCERGYSQPPATETSTQADAKVIPNGRTAPSQTETEAQLHQPGASNRFRNIDLERLQDFSPEYPSDVLTPTAPRAHREAQRQIDQIISLATSSGIRGNLSYHQMPIQQAPQGCTQHVTGAYASASTTNFMGRSARTTVNTPVNGNVGMGMDSRSAAYPGGLGTFTSRPPIVVTNPNYSQTPPQAQYQPQGRWQWQFSTPNQGLPSGTGTKWRWHFA